MTDGADPAEETAGRDDRPLLTVRQAEVALAVAIAVIAIAYAFTDSGSAIRFVVTFAAAALALVALRSLFGRRGSRK
ncbi:MAG: hypothetical protein QOE98_2853 [Gaiellaceae bacterium]|jgi:hypothetical protein|nr:hypothetical protein [Gaiellaceae bacterium]